MPETRSAPEPEPTQVERAERILTRAIAGQGIVRRMVLYCVTGFVLVALSIPAGMVGVVFGGLGLIALLLLSMTDGGLS